MKFYGRKNELKVLNREIRLSEKQSRMTVVTGRRRVGKTTLILKAAKESGHPTLYFFCRRKYTEEALALTWMDSVKQLFDLNSLITIERPTLANVIKLVMELSRKKPCILILDECQELDYVAPEFWTDLQCLWDLNREQSHLMLIMSGSIAAALRHIFDDASEPLFGRQDLSLKLLPFQPCLLREIFLDCYPQGSSDDLLTLYAVTGGVARYVSHLIDMSVPLTKKEIIRFIFSENGSFLRSDGATLLANEFRLESAIYESILRAIARGTTKWTEISDSLNGRSISGYMDRLENQYGLIKKRVPLLTTSPRGVRYTIGDPYLRFWFKFIEPADKQSLAESQSWLILQEICLKELDNFTGRTLEDWFYKIYAGSSLWSKIGQWWDRKGDNEIDLIALNELNGSFEISEIKRNPAKINLKTLEIKAEAFKQAAGKYLKGYSTPRFRGLSLDDLLKEPDFAVED